MNEPATLPSCKECCQKCILVFSGKRKSGKDFLAELLCNRFGQEKCTVLRLSGPLKQQYAKENGLDFEALLDSSAYKETFRAKMIKWSEDMRKKDPYYFCNATIRGADATKPLWIVSDARRKTDIQFFREKYRHTAKFVRIQAEETVRKQRGYIFTSGIDDAESECGLDEGVDWDFIVGNNGNEDEFNVAIERITEYIVSVMEQM